MPNNSCKGTPAGGFGASVMVRHDHTRRVTLTRKAVSTSWRSGSRHRGRTLEHRSAETRAGAGGRRAAASVKRDRVRRDDTCIVRLNTKLLRRETGGREDPGQVNFLS